MTRELSILPAVVMGAGLGQLLLAFWFGWRATASHWLWFSLGATTIVVIEYIFARMAWRRLTRIDND